MSRAERSTARELRAAAPVFAALGDETRLRIVARLGTGGPASIARLTEGSGVTRQAISKHLLVLETAGLVRSARQGRESVYELHPRELETARRALDRISAAWDDALDRLAAHVERD
ncbi:ArsR/SmtB family transcription factor [Sandaracinus amylolyticus]|uniref:Transcriptional regulator, ArsR family protein n=1 Tax=Sandaracinus amylolyticus TaxID=927083 RepID=A0A0F6SDI7_9BACT|nr:metalloregulator ArsR/SmtB family transcription factor [Sandaracinus amylolyticus]AKF03514.1 Transcriptional regulator, ArsR family protein [Sandaracinus amylolyticus]